MSTPEELLEVLRQTAEEAAEIPAWLRELNEQSRRRTRHIVISSDEPDLPFDEPLSKAV